ncbi:MAG: beta-3-deoxy-D-manno-oct-2-ulosonic acid transferase [Hyphomicrobiales bacterium]|nr:beta-3-deoxy-D-manno-oct-2-ulosonic acid transferase [Hyphomicrobiales bacterium]
MRGGSGGGPLSAVAFGVSFWNRRSLAPLLSVGGGSVAFIADFDAALRTCAERKTPLYAWASKLTPEREAACAAACVDLIRVEDGFVRSAGLGAGLVAGASYAFDRQGAYYDPTRPSDLETLLRERPISEAEAARGARLRAAILAADLTKYNLGGRAAPLHAPAGARIVLVPGQVSDDAAVANAPADWLGGEANINLALLKRARARNPKAFIVYKPHPDVEAGLRKGAIPAAQTLALADAIATGADVGRLIDACDAVETYSSLTGFEALLRGKPVTAHGAPFYAGWGLTEDLAPTPRRGRRRSLDEMLFTALCLYTRHVHPMTLAPCQPEALIEALAALKADPRQRIKAAALRRASWAGRKLGL